MSIHGSIRSAWYFGGLLISLVLVVNLLACSAPSESQPTPTRLSFACRQSDLALFSALAEQFHTENPTIFISVKPWPDAIFQASADQAGQQVAVRQLAAWADAFMWFSQAAETGAQGVLKDLSSLADTEQHAEPDRTDAARAAQIGSGGKIWGLPAGLDPFVLLYAPAAFSESGLPEPGMNWSWDDLLASAQKLTRTDASGAVRYGFSDYELDAVISVVASKSSGAASNVAGDVETQLGALRWYADLALAQGVMPNPAGQQLFNPISLVQNDQTAMVVSPASLWLQSVATDRRALRIAPLPDVNVAQAYGYFISAGSAHPDAAYLWISYLADRAQMRDLVPARLVQLDSWGRSAGLDAQELSAVATMVQRLLIPPPSTADAAALKQATTLILEGQKTDAARMALLQSQESQVALPTVEPFSVKTAPETETIQIVFATPAYNPPAYAALIETFERANPGLSVKIVNALDANYSSGSPDALLSQKTVDCFVGVAPQRNQIAAYRSAVLHLQPLVEADRTFPWVDYFPHALAQLTFEDGLWGIPAGIQPWVLWSDRSIFDRAQMAYPNAAWTWDDLLDAAQRLASQDEDGDAYGFLLDPFLSSATLLEEMVGVPLLDNAFAPPRLRFNEPTSREAVLRLQALVHARVVPLRKPGADSQLFFDLVRSNRLAMWRGSAMAVPPQPDGPLQPAPLPHGLQSQSCYDYADSPTWAYYINAQSQHVQASWLWVRFLADQLPVANYLTPRRSLLASDTFRDQVGAEAQAVYMAAANCQPATSASSLETAMPHAWRARIWLAQALDAVIWQDADADTELAAAQHTAEAYLACYQACPDPADVNCAHACMIATDPATEKLFVTP